MSTASLLFFPGLHQPADAKHFRHACINVHRLERRRSPIPMAEALHLEKGEAPEVIIDCSGFNELRLHGAYRDSVASYAAKIRRAAELLPVGAAVSQDYMCEPIILSKTGLTVAEHQRLTIERYDALVDEDLPVPVMPAIQGFDPADYARHVEQYGGRLHEGMWVGVGSVCKRNASPTDVANVLAAIHWARADLRLHGFGLKLTALTSAAVRALLHSADSMAWSFAAKQQAHVFIRALQTELGRKVTPREAREVYARRGIKIRNPNDWREAEAFELAVGRVTGLPQEPWQIPMPLWTAA